MKSKIRRSQISHLKIFTTPKMSKSNKRITYLNKSRDDYSTKAKTNDGGFNDEDKIKIENFSSNVNLTQYESSPKSNYEFTYDYSSPKKNNNSLRSEKLLRREDISIDDNRGRNIILKTPFNLSNKFKNSKLSLNKKNVNKLSLSLSLLNSMDYNKRNAVTLSLNSPKYKKKNTYNKNFNSSSWKHFKFLTEVNLLHNKNKKIESSNSVNLYSRNDDDKNNKILPKNRSYDVSPKNILLKINKINEKIKLINKENNFCTYIKVNKKHINQKDINTDSKIDMNINESNKTINNDTINNNNNENNSQEKKTIKNIKIIRLERPNRNNNQQIINNNVNPLENNYINNSNEKNDEKMFDINKAENNIFLDKTYQNRFRKKTKINTIKNDIFTTEKQKEYNTIIVKKKSNFLNNLITINSTISTSNSSNNKSNNKNKSSKNWVYRLYNQEIKKQKIKNKIIYSLRKSILNDAPSGTRNKKQINKSNSKKLFKYKYMNNNNFNFDEKFNVIDLFISDDKKIKNRRKKKYKGFHNYQHHHDHKMERYSYDDNYQISENESSENNSEEEKMDKIRKDKMRTNSKNRKGKKFLFLYNEELINEEDEEKEKDDDE